MQQRDSQPRKKRPISSHELKKARRMISQLPYLIQKDEKSRGKVGRRAGPFLQGSGDWTEYRKLQPSMEVDFHPPDVPCQDRPWHQRGLNEGEVWDRSMEALKKAQEQGYAYVLFRHGHSTSGPFRTTARSIVRKLMRGKEATPYIVRRNCIQHESVFVAAIRLPPGQTTIVERAQEFLKQRLSDGGWHIGYEVARDAEEAGIPKRILELSADCLGVTKATRRIRGDFVTCVWRYEGTNPE